MAAQAKGKIINVASLMIAAARKTAAAYTASKGGIGQLSVAAKMGASFAAIGGHLLKLQVRGSSSLLRLWSHPKDGVLLAAKVAPFLTSRNSQLTKVIAADWADKGSVPIACCRRSSSPASATIAVIHILQWGAKQPIDVF